jgi:glutamate synthase (ferredoxin)
MSLEMHLGERCSPFESNNIKPFIHLNSPIINEEELISLKESKLINISNEYSPLSKTVFISL